MPLTAEITAEAKARLVRETDRYGKLAKYIESECLKVVRRNGIPATVQSRVKKPESFETKLTRYLESGNTEKIDALSSVDTVFRCVGDIAAVRVATYVEADRERVVRLIEKHFSGVVTERHAKNSGYRATHCQVLLPAPLLEIEDTANISDLSCEIQVCSMLAHVWNEIEHDIRYKLYGVEDVDGYEISRLQALLDVTKEGDGYIEELLQGRSLRVARTLADTLADKFPSSPDFRLRAEFVIREAVRLGYSDVDGMSDGLLHGDFEAHARAIIEVVNEALISAGRDALALNPDTSDVLLALLLDAHCADIRALHYREIEGGAPSRIPELASFIDDQSLSLDYRDA
jgi:ppGpp synthetase/RelA/SpoT-type nucleotidyltranferase